MQDQTEWDPRKKKGKHSKRGKIHFEFGTVLCALRTHIQKSNSTNMRAFVIEIRRLLRFKIGRTLSAAEDSEITIVTGRYTVYHDCNRPL